MPDPRGPEPSDHDYQQRVAFLEQRLELLDELLRVRELKTGNLERLPGLPSLLFQGATLLSIIGFAFWLGTTSNTVTESSKKLDKLYEIVVQSKDALVTRTGVIETKLDAIDKKLTPKR